MEAPAVGGGVVAYALYGKPLRYALNVQIALGVGGYAALFVAYTAYNSYAKRLGSPVLFLVSLV